ncbi:M20 family metallopeptidase [Roseomonas sp. SSH11]|uniref:M20 family metallopeptidase n=1 Tax=Pararoseomonas baculiformis TaxID=2820812 RepID=A0ABS4ADX1_9PROT|nr:M20 family metallopeptidase [Pararoseomonas baculiformis]MBP0445207.1 M20 family metallopeptidase [Pararoseomonas baculiformis]
MSADTESRVLEWLAGRQGEMLATLEAMVNTDGGSYDKAGVDAVGEQVRAFFSARGIPVETVTGERFGDCLRATLAAEGDAAAQGNAQRNIVLMGHRDTVFPKGEPERRPFRVEDGIAYGPGVADMKAGLVMNMFVIAAFKEMGGAPGPLVGLFTGDEEIGSPEGRPVIEDEARRARVVFNSEPGRPGGGVVTGRKGGVFMVMDIEGRAAHSGGNFEAGISAIGELAQKVTAIHALTDLKRGITLNVGLVSGGQSVNTVAPSAQMQIDLRYVEPADREEVMGKIHDIVAKSFVPGTKAVLTIRGEFLPLTQTPAAARMFEMYRGAASESGLQIKGEFSGGCADSGFTAAVGAPTLCAVGPVGGKAHSPEEYLEVASLVPRAQALARAILRLDRAGL